MIDACRDRFGVEPICRVLQVPSSTYYAAKRRPPSARQLRDQQLTVQIRRVWEATISSTGPARSGGSSNVRASRSPAARSSG